MEVVAKNTVIYLTEISFQWFHLHESGWLITKETKSSRSWQMLSLHGQTLSRHWPASTVPDDTK